MASYRSNLPNLLIPLADSEDYIGTTFDGDPLERTRVLENMVNDLTSRWRRSTTLALNSIGALEEELAKRGLGAV